MQGLWSRTASSQSTCRCFSCISTVANGLASRTTSAASRRRLRIGNSVTALYSSIFAAAVVVDARAKNKRRLELEEKIAAVKEEVNELVDEEQRILAAIASRRRRRVFNRPFQIRSYSTSAAQPEAGQNQQPVNKIRFKPYNEENAMIKRQALDARENNEGRLGDERAEQAMPEGNDASAAQPEAGQIQQSAYKIRHIPYNEEKAMIKRMALDARENNEGNDTSAAQPQAGQNQQSVNQIHFIPNAISGEGERAMINREAFDTLEDALSEFEGRLEDESEEQALPEGNDAYVDPKDVPKWAIGKPLRVKAIQKLAMKQLAIRLLLRPLISHNYSGIPINYDRDAELPKLHVSELLDQLNAIRRRIHVLKNSKKAYYDDLARKMTSSETVLTRARCDQLDTELFEYCQLYLANRMSLQDLLLRVSHNLLQSPDPDRPTAFRMLIMVFGKTRQNDLVQLVFRTMLPNMFTLNTSLIITSITFFRKSKDLKNFDLFLEMLGGAGYPTNLRPARPWKRMVINGVEITVPLLPSTNPVIYSTLIIAALRFDQPDRADAWLQAARSNGFMDDFGILYAYLKFYSIRADWEKGIHTLKRCLAFITSSTVHVANRVERLIVLMIHLCDSCGQPRLAKFMVRAAVQSGFNRTMAEEQRDIDSYFDPGFRRWKTYAGSVDPKFRFRPCWEKCYDFASTINKLLSEFAVTREESPARKRELLIERFSEDILSNFVGGRRSKPTDDPEKARTQEILALKNEVLQLRELSMELRQTLMDTIPRDFLRRKLRYHGDAIEGLVNHVSRLNESETIPKITPNELEGLVNLLRQARIEDVLETRRAHQKTLASGYLFSRPRKTRRHTGSGLKQIHLRLDRPHPKKTKDLHQTIPEPEIEPSDKISVSVRKSQKETPGLKPAPNDLQELQTKGKRWPVGIRWTKGTRWTKRRQFGAQIIYPEDQAQ